MKQILNPNKEKKTVSTVSPALDAVYRKLENTLKEKMNRKVEISAKGKNGAGKIEIEFYSNEDLEKLTEFLASMNQER